MGIFRIIACALAVLAWVCLGSVGHADTEAPNLDAGEELFLRIIKTVPGNSDGILEAYAGAPGEAFAHIGTWDICAWSGKLGPKRKQGDRQAPEGFYFVTPSAMNPNSRFHLSFNLGYPNAFDRAHGRTGDFLMVHGDCVSIGCYAMTDEGIEEIYALMEQAFAGGQPFVRVHAFPFPMTDANLERHARNPNHAFWENLKEGWDAFEATNRPPNVEVEDGRYVFEDAPNS